MKKFWRASVLMMFLALTSCGEKQEVKELGCGVEMSGYEVMDTKTLGNKGFTYSEADNKLALEMGDAASRLVGEEDEVKIAFVEKDDSKFAAFVVGPAEIEQVEKISCMIFSDFSAQLPKEKKLLFYTDDHNTLVAAIKTKKAEQ